LRPSDVLFLLFGSKTAVHVVYFLLKNPEARASEIVRYAGGLPRHVYTVLRRLETLGIVKRIEKNKKMVYYKINLLDADRKVIAYYLDLLAQRFQKRVIEYFAKKKREYEMLEKEMNEQK